MKFRQLGIRRFGIRHLCLFIGICVIPMVWMQMVRDERAAELAAIHECQMMGASVSLTPNDDSKWVRFKSRIAGGDVEPYVTLRFESLDAKRDTRGPYGPNGKAVLLYAWNDENVPRLGPCFRQLSGITSLSFRDSPMKPGALAEILPSLPHLVYLNLSGTGLGSEDFAALSRLPNLQRINFSDTDVTDADLDSISKLDLNLVLIENTRITDRGIAKLAHLRNVESINLGLTRITEASIPILAKWQVTNRLLVPAEWSSGGVAELQSLSPKKCQVYKNGYSFRTRPGARALQAN